MRVSYLTMPQATTLSIVGAQTSGTLQSYPAKSGSPILIVRTGIASADQMFAHAQAANKTMAGESPLQSPDDDYSELYRKLFGEPKTAQSINERLAPGSTAKAPGAGAESKPCATGRAVGGMLGGQLGKAIGGAAAGC